MNSNSDSGSGESDVSSEIAKKVIAEVAPKLDESLQKTSAALSSEITSAITASVGELLDEVQKSDTINRQEQQERAYRITIIVALLAAAFGSLLRAVASIIVAIVNDFSLGDAIEIAIFFAFFALFAGLAFCRKFINWAATTLAKIAERFGKTKG